MLSCRIQVHHMHCPVVVFTVILNGLAVGRLQKSKEEDCWRKRRKKDMTKKRAIEPCRCLQVPSQAVHTSWLTMWNLSVITQERQAGNSKADNANAKEGDDDEPRGNFLSFYQQQQNSTQKKETQNKNRKRKKKGSQKGTRREAL